MRRSGSCANRSAAWRNRSSISRIEKVRRFASSLSACGGGPGWKFSNTQLFVWVDFPHPPRIYERVDLPRKRERLSAPPRAISGSHFKQPDTTSHSRGTIRPRFALTLVPPKNERAQGRPGARCTRGLVCNVHKEKRTRAYRFSGNTPAFPAQWFYGLYRALPGDRAFLSPSLLRSVSFLKLDTSIGVSGPHDFAVRFSAALVSRACRVHRIPPRVRDDRAYAPLVGRDGASW